MKFPIGELSEDPGSPGLMVCKKDKDVLDPYRLPVREEDHITIYQPRPDLG